MRGAPPATDTAPAAAGAVPRAGAPADDDDRSLAERASRDGEAFAQLYRRYVGAIYEFAYRRSRSRDLAEDVTSATFEKALGALERFEWKRGGFRAWIYRIAANELTDQFRRRQRDTTPRAQRTLQALVRELNHIYRAEPALWEADAEPLGFRFIDADNVDDNVIAFIRIAPKSRARSIICVCNFAPVVRNDYRVGVPVAGEYREILNTDSELFGGGNLGNAGAVTSEAVSRHGFDHSLVLRLPPLAVLWLAVP